MIGRVLPVLHAALALAGHVFSVVMGEVMAKCPANWTSKGSNASHEANDPSNEGTEHECVQAHLREVSVLGSPRHQLVTDEVGHSCCYNATNQTGEDVCVSKEAAWLTVLLWLRNSHLLVNYCSLAHAVLFPPCSRTHESN